SVRALAGPARQPRRVAGAAAALPGRGDGGPRGRPVGEQRAVRRAAVPGAGGMTDARSTPLACVPTQLACRYRAMPSGAAFSGPRQSTGLRRCPCPSSAAVHGSSVGALATAGGFLLLLLASHLPPHADPPTIQHARH